MGWLTFKLSRTRKLQVSKGKAWKGKYAKLYIIKRCVLMLICWSRQGNK
ncbi:hypothetical protein AAZX31_07G052600 [Glycine max]